MEMQNFPEKHFFKRTLFYLSRLYTEGLKKGGSYNQLPDTYLLILTNFTLFKQAEAYYSSFSLRRDEVPHFMFHRALRVVTVELGKFPEKRISALLDLKEQWCYMLRRSFRMGREELNRLGERSSDMKQVTNHFLELSASEQDRLLEEHREKSRLVLHNQREYVREKIHRQVGEYMKRMAEGTTEDMEIEPDIKEIIEQEIQESMEQIRKAGMEAGRRKGMEQGRKKGMEQGRKKGMEQGRKKGMEQGRRKGMEQGMEAGVKQVILQMLKEKADINFISRVTGITKEKVLKLKTKID